MAVSAKVASAYVDLVARTTAFEKALNDAQGHVRKFNQTAAAEMREAKGSVALLGEEMGVHLPRHLQTFIAKLPGVSTAMSAAFNTIAVLALIDIVFKAGEKVVEFAQKNEASAKKNVEAWESVNKPLVESNDALRVTNDRLENSIAKMEHKPQNGLKLAIDEAIESADKLSTKLDADMKKITTLLKDSAPSRLGEQLFVGMAPTDDIKDEFENLQGRIRDTEINGRASLEAARGSKDPDAVKSAQAALDQRLSDLYTEGQKFAQGVYDSARLAAAAQQNPHAFPMSYSTGWNSQNMGARLDASRGLLDYFNAAQDTVSLGAGNRSLNSQSGSLTASNEAAQLRLKAFEDEFERQKQLYGMSVGQDRAFWEDKLRAFTEGSDQYRAVFAKYTAASVAFSKEFEAIRKRTIGENDAAPVFKDTGAGADALAAAMARNSEEAAKLNLQWVEARDKEQLATGAINAHTAALDIQAAHTAEYRAQLQALTDQLAELKAAGALSEVTGIPDRENLAKQQNVQGQIDKLNAANRISQMQDALRVTDTSWRGMIDSVFNELARKANETSSQIRQIALHTIDSINTELAKGATGGKMDFSKIFHEASQSLAKTGIEKAEGLIFGGSHKKADGYHVHVDNMPGDGAGGGIAKQAGGGLLGLLNDSNWFSSLFGGRLFGAGSIFGGGHAMGGDVAAGVPIDVGELGVERFTPMVPGRVTPNKDMGHGGPLVGYIDARGTDPALSRANLERALRQTHAQSVATATHAMREAQLRRPQ